MREFFKKKFNSIINLNSKWPPQKILRCSNFCINLHKKRITTNELKMIVSTIIFMKNPLKLFKTVLQYS